MKSMDQIEKLLQEVRAALESEPRLDVRAWPLELTVADGVLTIEGDVLNVAQKKLALERAAAVHGVIGILDRLRVRPAQPMGDREILDHVRDALLQEPAFKELALREDRGGWQAVREPATEARGRIDVAVEAGIVTLNGQVSGLDQKRLAGVLAWWVPGSRDVINGIAVEPPEDDSDAAIADALRLVLEKDPFVDASQLRFSVRDAVVTLTGIVPKEAERDMAEYDGWYLFGVDKVINRVEVRAG
jgi:osmotically-inducible protein OsmY